MIKKKEKRFIEKETHSYQYGTIIILVDLQTGVHYLHTWSAQGNGLTPLLDENGEVVIEKVQE
ncbi:DUF6440 family protein [Alkalicoccobacillus porphyridii]|uniref:DUF6440 domain-containing protein n=1 Tax=Alkalicoccobacillus porphyridii TaxID=2597270 RepID=A0A553ZVV3_9BACI|nr:DUF6440 family protein [Alkalicoccobacillus porphyridii]TSB45562.1 hypothetical protein FN960_15445 [Alkalicoccobacillus porphyridii]